MNIIASIAWRDAFLAGMWIAVAGLVYWVVSWATDKAETPPPFNKVIKVVAAVAAAGFAIYQIVELAQKV